PTTDTSTLSLHDALPISSDADAVRVQGFVLDQMAQQGYITVTQRNDAKAEKLVIAPSQGQRYRAPHFVYAVRAAANDLLGGENRSEEHTSELQSRFDLVC